MFLGSSLLVVRGQKMTLLLIVAAGLGHGLFVAALWHMQASGDSRTRGSDPLITMKSQRNQRAHEKLRVIFPTPHQAAAIYDCMREFPPFRQWKLPPAEEVTFTVNLAEGH